MSMEGKETSNELVFECPHCNKFILVHRNEINCGIFRCAFNTNTFQQCNPHLTQQQMKVELERDGVVGCGQPFEIVENKARKCSWSKQQASR